MLIFARGLFEVFLWVFMGFLAKNPQKIIFGVRWPPLWGPWPFGCLAIYVWESMQLLWVCFRKLPRNFAPRLAFFRAKNPILKHFFALRTKKWSKVTSRDGDPSTSAPSCEWFSKCGLTQRFHNGQTHLLSFDLWGMANIFGDPMALVTPKLWYINLILCIQPRGQDEPCFARFGQ